MVCTGHAIITAAFLFTINGNTRCNFKLLYKQDSACTEAYKMYTTVAYEQFLFLMTKRVYNPLGWVPFYRLYQWTVQGGWLSIICVTYEIGLKNSDITKVADYSFIQNEKSFFLVKWNVLLLDWDMILTNKSL